jgi:tripartite-type tricarboxylate transporter receptor subunit TctC
MSMTISRRHLLMSGTTLLAMPALVRAQAVDAPKFLYGFPAGSAGDITARRVAEKVAGTSYARNAAVVENKPGAGGRLALDALKASPADGSVLCMTPFSALAIYPHVYRKLSYDPFADFVPVSMSAVMHHGLAVGPMVPATVKTVKDFLAWAKANPNDASYGSPGAGSTPHFLGALLGLNAGVELKHVPYRGSVPGITDVVGGQLAAMVTPAGDFLSYHKAGKLRLLATSGKARLPFSIDVPTFAEQGFSDIMLEEWFGFFAPAKTPAPVVALTDKSVIEGLGVVGLIAQGSSGEDLTRSLRAENERWGPLVKRIGFTADS